MTARPATSSAGFSLIEVMVVVAITSVLALGATLILPGRDGAEKMRAAFLSDAEDMRMRAMLSGDDHAIAADATGWTRERRAADGWTTLDRRSARIGQGGRLVFHADGRVTGAAIGIGAATLCAAGDNGGVTCRPAG